MFNYSIYRDLIRKFVEDDLIRYSNHHSIKSMLLYNIHSNDSLIIKHNSLSVTFQYKDRSLIESTEEKHHNHHIK